MHVYQYIYIYIYNIYTHTCIPVLGTNYFKKVISYSY